MRFRDKLRIFIHQTMVDLFSPGDGSVCRRLLVSFIAVINSNTHW